MKVIQCDLDAVSRLAELNKQLIEDEKSSNPMNLEQLKERMTQFLTTDYHAYFFYVKDEVVGYALVKHTCEPLYLRQFCIDRKFRRNHFGKEAFQSLLETLNVSCIDLEVLPWNEPGMKFWESCGFKEKSRYLQFHK